MVQLRVCLIKKRKYTYGGGEDSKEMYLPNDEWVSLLFYGSQIFSNMILLLS